MSKQIKEHHSVISSESEIDPFYNDSDSDPEYNPHQKGKKRDITDYFNVSRTKKLRKKYEHDNSNGANDKNEETISELVSNSELDFSTMSTSTTELSETQDNAIKNKLMNSALFDGKFFSVISVLGKQIEVKCELCTKDTRLRCLSSVNSNILKHLKKAHTGSYEKYEQYKREKNKTKRRHSDLIQPTINFPRKKQQNQKEFDQKLVEFFVDTMIPTSIVERHTFKNLFTNSVTIMSRRSLVRQIDETYKITKETLKVRINGIKYLCTTADIWSAKRRSFLGVTCHWLDHDLKRHSAALACRRFSGKHSYDRIADMLSEIHLSFGLDNKKIVATITDNGSNFVKAFREYGLDISNFNKEDGSSDSGEEDETESLNFASIDSNSECLFKYLSLPKHYRCASHTLNLLATTDINKAINENLNLRSRHEKVLRKCSVLWNKAARPKSAEIMKAVLGHTLSYPSITRWNSFYKSIMQILEEKDKLKELFQKLEIKDHFKDTELQYLQEYCTILRPVAETLNFLQGENNTFYGYLLPSIISLKVKLEKLREDVNLWSMKIILENVIDSLKKRFSHFFNINEDSHEAIIAATSIPTVKLRWLKVFKETDPSADSKAVIDIIVNKTMELFNSEILNKSDEIFTEVTTPDNDFFDFKEDLTEKQNMETDKSDHKLELEMRKYLEDKRYSIDMLQDYPLIKEIFIKFNTSLPSSGPVERLFSFATYINSPRRNALSDTLFEKLVFLKGNVYCNNL